MKRIEEKYLFLLFCLDFLFLNLVGIIAYFIRIFIHSFSLPLLSPVILLPPFNRFLVIIFLGSIFFEIVLFLVGTYELEKIFILTEQVKRVILGITAGISCFVLFLFFYKEWLLTSRFIILFYWIFTILILIISRILLKLIRRIRLKKGKDFTECIIIGFNKSAFKLKKELNDNPLIGYKVVLLLKEFDKQKLIELKTQGKIPVILIADYNLSSQKLNEILQFCKAYHFRFKFVPSKFETHFKNIDFETLFDIPIIEIRNTPLIGWKRFLKRIIDIIVSIILLVILSPLFLIIAILIKTDSKGPIFVKLERVGYDGKKFLMYKFRSMIKDAHKLKKTLLKYNERKGPLFKMKNDPRITKIGRYLRKYSIDELPQLLNVLKGEMSLVGPRPHEPEEVLKYQEYQKELLSIKPGITGLAQISGRSELAFEQEAMLDLYYIENWSILLDFFILFKTIKVVLKRESAC